MKYFWIVLLCLLWPGMHISGQTYMQMADSVDRFTKERNWQASEKWLLKALKKEPANPNNYLLLSNLGTVHRNMGRLSDALADYDNALSITPNAVTILHNRAALLMEMDSTRRAYADYGRIMELDKKDVASRYFHGMIALGYGQLDIARGDFEGALTIDKKSVDAKRGMAALNKIEGKAQEAVQLYTDVIKEENRLSNYLSRAECYMDLGRLPEAEADLQEAQKLNPSDSNIYLLKARLSTLLYRYDDAVAYAKQARSLGADADAVEEFMKKRP